MSQLLSVLRKDLLIEWRAWIRIVALFSFAVMTLLLFSFAVGPNTAMLRSHAAGYLWLGTMFASSMLFSASFQVETESNAVEQLLLAPVAPAAIFYGKALANALQLLLLAAFMMPFLVALCDVQLTEGPAALALALLLGVLGLAAPGALYSAMTARISSQQVLLPLLLFPLIVPALLASVKATSLIFTGDPMGQLSSWLQLLAAFDLVYWSLCGVLFGRVLES